MSSTFRNFLFKKTLLSTVQKKLINYFYRYPYLSDILLGIGLGVFLIGIFTAATMTWGTSLIPTLLTMVTILGGSLGNTAGFTILGSSLLFACGLIAAGCGLITNSFLSKRNLRVNKQADFKMFQTTADPSTTKSVVKYSPQSTVASLIKEITDDESITVTRSGLQKILAIKSLVENPYRETYFIGSERVREYLSKIEDVNKKSNRRKVKVRPTRLIEEILIIKHNPETNELSTNGIKTIR